MGPWGPLAVAGACACWAIDNNLTRKVSANDAVLIACIKGLAAGAVNVCAAVLVGQAFPGATTGALAALLGFFGYGVSLVLFVVALRHLGTARTGAYFSVAPFFGAVLALVLFGEPASTALIAGGALMATGVWLHITERHEHPHEHEPIEHEHPHGHDEHHQHSHEFAWDGREPPDTAIGMRGCGTSIRTIRTFTISTGTERAGLRRVRIETAWRLAKPLCLLAPRVGIEPTTCGLTVRVVTSTGAIIRRETPRSAKEPCCCWNAVGGTCSRVELGLFLHPRHLIGQLAQLLRDLGGRVAPPYFNHAVRLLPELEPELGCVLRPAVDWGAFLCRLCQRVPRGERITDG